MLGCIASLTAARSFTNPPNFEAAKARAEFVAVKLAREHHESAEVPEQAKAKGGINAEQ